jgi:hypothetical protein
MSITDVEEEQMFRHAIATAALGLSLLAGGTTLTAAAAAPAPAVAVADPPVMLVHYGPHYGSGHHPRPHYAPPPRRYWHGYAPPPVHRPRHPAHWQHPPHRGFRR